MGWPAVTWEERVWQPPPDRVGVTRAERSAVGRTYLAAVPATIASRDLTVSSRVAAQAEEARELIAELEAQVQQPDAEAKSA